jgi:monoamine oxidase
VDSNAVMEYMRRPFKDAPLYVCGEAWSRQQGWVEGALETADLVLEKTLHLPALK